VFLGEEHSAITSFLSNRKTPRLLVAADIPDTLQLLIEGHELVRRRLSDGVGVLIEETIAGRHQSVDLHVLEETIRRRTLGVPDASARTRSDSAVGADVGFLAWGAAQGVVRDAVALCRRFGLRVAALYPHMLVPFPTEELEAFAKTVTRLVLVESDPLQGYGDRVHASCSLNPAVLNPAPGHALTLMDIFLLEGLGTS
jgi:hypothetical protein